MMKVNHTIQSSNPSGSELPCNFRASLSAHTSQRAYACLFILNHLTQYQRGDLMDGNPNADLIKKKKKLWYLNQGSDRVLE
jgi:hypothetical protein